MAHSEGLSAEVEEFIRRNPVERMPADLDERFAWLVDYQRRMHESDLAVVSWPKEYGGRGLSPFEAIQVAEELGRAKAPELINFVAIEVLAPALMAYGTQEQLERWLPPMGAAERVWCQLFSEPDAGSDLASLRTRAEPCEGGWRITGAKVWSTWAQFAQTGLVLARTGPLDSRHRGISAFVIDMDQPGVEVHPLTTMTGAAEFAEVVFDGALVRSEDLVGEVDRGWAVTLHILENERGPYALRRAAVLGAGMARVREVAGRRPLTRAQRERVVDAEIAMRLLEHRASAIAQLLVDDQPLGMESTLTKVALTEAEQCVFALAHDLLGMDGCAWDGDEPEEVELYLYSRAASIYGGSAQIQRNVLAERFLGLPPEPKG
jgi:alkylation response protein AidB-like acyl-CoA dehydrogenase